MGIDLYWDNDEQTVLLMEFNGNWTWKDLHAVLNTIKKITEDREFPVGGIVDLSKGVKIPGGSVFNPEGLKQFQQILKMGGGKQGPMAIVGVNGMIRSILDAARKVDRKATTNVYFAPSLDEARSHLQNQLISARASA